MNSAPLAGIRALVGRAPHQASALSSGLSALGAEVLSIPFIEIRKPTSYRPLNSALKQLADYDWLILTSVNGVEALWERAEKLAVTKRSFEHLKIAAIGPATKSAIERQGLKVEVVPDKYVAEAVVESLQERVSGKRVLLARAKVAREVIPDELRKLGAQVDVVEAYQTIVPRRSREQLQSALRGARRPDVVAFTSSSTVRNFMELLGRKITRRQLKGIQFASIGPVTSSTLRELGLPVHIEAKQYTIPGLIEAIV
ncbi:MAG: uroporphyrinogen-III synthase, partial [Acidobacteriaceae bacterium]|nr:uroporphyrinogen-III synthase [Acidobacteriaceae bacterium]